jgi:tRNA(fMet)-specific endonuclease VapC
MSDRIVLDTNAYSNLLRGDQAVLDALGDAERSYLPVTVIGELYSGFKGGNQEQRNRGQLKQFLGKPSVKILQTTIEVAEYFAQIVDSLKRKKTPIPTNDVWIAAHTMDQGAVLVTYDEHFKNIDGLRIWK